MSGSIDSVIELGDRRLHARMWGDPPASVVMLHDGLGSISQFRDLPERLNGATGDTVLAYDRAGHGRSLPTPRAGWPADWLQTEADVLAALLAETGVDRPMLVGHSDGASIALIHAANAGESVAGLVALAPHSFVEARCVDAIAAMRDQPTELLEALAEHHTDPISLFDAWSGAWVSDGFRDWDITHRLSEITAPTLVLQGSRDEYASEEMLWSIVSAIGPGAEGRLLDGLGHLFHHEAPELVTELIAGFDH